MINSQRGPDQHGAEHVSGWPTILAASLRRTKTVLMAPWMMWPACWGARAPAYMVRRAMPLMAVHAGFLT